MNWIALAFVLLAAVVLVAAQDCITLRCVHVP
jgi:hypothetical protein